MSEKSRDVCIALMLNWINKIPFESKSFFHIIVNAFSKPTMHRTHFLTNVCFWRISEHLSISITHSNLKIRCFTCMKYPSNLPKNTPLYPLRLLRRSARIGNIEIHPWTSRNRARPLVSLDKDVVFRGKLWGLVTKYSFFDTISPVTGFFMRQDKFYWCVIYTRRRRHFDWGCWYFVRHTHTLHPYNNKIAFTLAIL